MSILTIPTTNGYVVEIETNEISKRTGNHIWHEVLLTQDEKEANRKYEQLLKDGKNARMFECIF